MTSPSSSVLMRLSVFSGAATSANTVIATKLVRLVYMALTLQSKHVPMETIIKLLKKHEVSDKTILRLYIVFSLFIGVLGFSIGCYLITLFTKNWICALLCAAFIIATCIMLNWLSKTNGTIAKLSQRILNAGYTMLSFFMDFAYPGFILFFGLFIVIILSIAIPLVSVLLLNCCNIISLSNATVLFVSIAIASIISVYCTRFSHWILKNFSPLKDWGEHQYQKYQIELVLYVVNGKNINFLVNFLYLVYLSSSGFCMIQYHAPLFSEIVDSAILKAFLVYMAFSGMVKSYQGKSISSDVLYAKMLSMILASNRYSNDKTQETILSIADEENE